jgi:hypothetical protein
MSTRSGDGAFDMERFFRRSSWDVGSSLVWRWFAACEAAYELTAPKR